MDYYENNSKSLGPNNTYVYALRYKSTALTAKSPRINGILKLQENPYNVTIGKITGSVPLWGISSSKTVHGYAFPAFEMPSYYDVMEQPDVGYLTKVATQNAYAKLANAQFQLCEYIAERRSLINGVVSGATQIKNLYTAIQAGRDPYGLLRRKSHRWLTKLPLGLRVAQLWLAYHFMWKPILEDIKKSLDGLKPVEGLYVIGRASASKVSSSKTQMGKFHYSKLHKVETTVKVKLYFTIEDPLLAMQSELGLLTPVSAWNLMPFSFVVDWFFSIGAMIERLSMPGKIITAGSTTVTRKYDLFHDAQAIGIYNISEGLPPVEYITIGSGVREEIIRKTRSLGIPSGAFIISNPFGLGLWNGITAWALLTSIFSGRRP